MSDEITVYVAIRERNLLAGRLYPHRRRGIESASFVYDDRYLADPDAYALDPALPLVTGALQTPVGRALFGAFGDCAPDRWGRTLIKRAEIARAKLAGTAPRSMSEAEILLGVRDDLRQGALRFRLWPGNGSADLPGRCSQMRTAGSVIVTECAGWSRWCSGRAGSRCLR